eukprot:s6822_g3.t5
MIRRTLLVLLLTTAPLILYALFSQTHRFNASIATSIRSKLLEASLSPTSAPEEESESKGTSVQADEAAANTMASVGDEGRNRSTEITTTEPSTTKSVTHMAANYVSRSSADFCRCAQQGDENPPASAKEEFSKLLAEMRQNLRLFVYPLTTKCGKSQSGNRGYWVEGIFYSRALASPLRVENPDAATIFYIPTFTSCWRSQVPGRREGGERAARELQRTLRKVASQWPHFHRYMGRRHLWVSAHDMGKVEPSWCPEHQKTSNTSDRCPSHHWANALAINSSQAQLALEERMAPLPSLCLVMYSGFLSTLALDIVVTTVEEYSRKLGAGALFSGLVIALTPLLQGLIGVPLNRWMLKSASMKTVSILMAAGMVVGHIIYALAGLMHSKLAVLFARALIGVCQFQLGAPIYIADAVGVKRRTPVLFVYSAVATSGLADRAASWLLLALTLGRGVGAQVGVIFTPVSFAFTMLSTYLLLFTLVSVFRSRMKQHAKAV